MSYLDCDLEMDFVNTADEGSGAAKAASNSTERPRVLVADPDRLARRALTDSLRADGDFAVIGQASDGVEAVELARHYRPDLVLVATTLTGMDAVTACEKIVSTTENTRVVMLATAADLELEMRAMRAGASGFVIKSDEAEAIKLSLSIVSSGHAMISPELTGVLVERLRKTPADGTGTRPVKSALTNREWEILDLMCGQMGTRDIADSLFLSPETVNSHVKNVLKKLGVHSRAAAVEAASIMRADVLV